MNPTLSLILALWPLPPGPAQEALDIPLAALNKLQNGGFGIVPLFEYVPGFLVNEGVEHAIRAPELSQDRSVAYGFIYFTGRPEGALGDSGAFLVEGYDTAEPRFFVDTNHNLDFNDDEPAAVREEGKRAFVLTQSPDGRPQQEFRVRITALRDRLGADQIPVYRDLFESFLQRMGGKAVAPELWYADQRLNILSTSTKRGELAFQIGVIDWNCNGSYADVGEDRVLVGGFEDEFLSCDPSRGATTLQEAALIQLAGQTFEVLHVDPAGAFVRIRATDRP